MLTKKSAKRGNNENYIQMQNSCDIRNSIRTSRWVEKEKTETFRVNTIKWGTESFNKRHKKGETGGGRMRWRGERVQGGRAGVEKTTVQIQ